MEFEELPPGQEKLVKKVVAETLLSLGLITHDPEEIVELQKDFRHLREWRKNSETIQRNSLWFVLSSGLAGMLALLWMGFKSTLTGD